MTSAPKQALKGFLIAFVVWITVTRSLQVRLDTWYHGQERPTFQTGEQWLYLGLNIIGPFITGILLFALFVVLVPILYAGRTSPFPVLIYLASILAGYLLVLYLIFFPLPPDLVLSFLSIELVPLGLGVWVFLIILNRELRKNLA
jgi:hypothetical protein